MNGTASVLVPKEKQSETVKKILADGKESIFSLNKADNESIKINIYPEFILGNTYESLLKLAGITELKENEVIITNTSKKEDSKYGDVIKYTDYKIRRYNSNY